MGASATLGRAEPAKMQRWEKLSMCGRHKALGLQVLGVVVAQKMPERAGFQKSMPMKRRRI